MNNDYESKLIKYNKIEDRISRKNTETILAKEYLGELRLILEKKNPRLPLFPKSVSSNEIQKQAKL